MHEVTATRTLVKSAPELWAQCSDPQSLSRHLNAFGEITITRLEPETTVAWEGERARGTVRIEPSGWGTKVTLTASASVEPPPDAPSGGSPEVVVERSPESGPRAAASPEPRRRGGLLGWLMVRRGQPDAVVADAVVADAVRSDAVRSDAVRSDAVRSDVVRSDVVRSEPVEPEPTAALDAALESLGQAHRRPFSRS